MTGAARLHHGAICAGDLGASLRFYTEGLGLQVLMDERFEGDWPALFNAGSRVLRSVFLGDPLAPDAGIVELVEFDGPMAGVPVAVAPAPGPGFFLLSFFLDVEAALGRLADLGWPEVARIHQPAPGGPVLMATVRDPDGTLVELIDTGADPA